jgi:hypothetical protein
MYDTVSLIFTATTENHEKPFYVFTGLCRAYLYVYTGTVF